MEIDLVFHEKRKHEQLEIFNLKNKKCQQKFYSFGSKDKIFSKCFMSDEESIQVQFRRWRRRFHKAIYASFKKIRVTESRKEKISKLYNLMIEKKKILRKHNLKMEDYKKVDTIEKETSKEVEDR